MPILVNGEIVPAELIREEERCLAQFAEWQGIPDGLEKGMRLRQAAERYVIDRVLLRRAADKDPRPIDPALVATHVHNLTAAQGWQIEAQLRHQTATRANPVGPPSRTTRVMKGGSYLFHASFCFRYRNAARTANTPDSATGNIGFHVVRDL